MCVCLCVCMCVCVCVCVCVSLYQETEDTTNFHVAPTSYILVAYISTLSLISRAFQVCGRHIQHHKRKDTKV